MCEDYFCCSSMLTRSSLSFFSTVRSRSSIIFADSASVASIVSVKKINDFYIYVYVFSYLKTELHNLLRYRMVSNTFCFRKVCLKFCVAIVSLNTQDPIVIDHVLGSLICILNFALSL